MSVWRGLAVLEIFPSNREWPDEFSRRRATFALCSRGRNIRPFSLLWRFFAAFLIYVSVLYYVIACFSFFSASIVALALFNLLVVVPKIFEDKLAIPARLAMTRTGPPAIIPFPSPAGLKRTTALENFPITSLRTVPF